VGPNIRGTQTGDAHSDVEIARAQLVTQSELIGIAADIAARSADVQSVAHRVNAAGNWRVADVLGRIGQGNESDDGIGGDAVGCAGAVAHTVNQHRIV